MSKLIAYLLVVVILAASTSAASSGAPIVANTTLGQIRGVLFEDIGVQTYKGVPFAASTGGSNRFRSPQPRQPWAPEVFDASDYGPGCPQTHHNPDVPKWQSEDCLNLNIWAPYSAAKKGSKAELQPVLIFFHGGTFIEGSGRGPFNFYNGSELAAKFNVVVVTTNYRLGALGALVSASTGGNFDLQDQRMALLWLRGNIANFGGDPEKVTIWGESAGATSVGLHLMSPLSEGLFSGAIMESNPFAARLKTVKEASAYGRAVAKAVNCDETDLACLQAAPLADILKATNSVPNQVDVIIEGNFGHWIDAMLAWSPTVVPDADDIPMQPVTAFEKGLYLHDIPVIIGTNTNEADTFLDSAIPNTTQAWEVDTGFVVIFGIENVPRIETRYERILPKSMIPSERLNVQMTDYLFRCSSEYLASSMGRFNDTSFVFRFDQIASFAPELYKLAGAPYCANKVCHEAELPFVWNQCGNWSFTAEEQTLVEQMQSYWVNFARYGNPNGVSKAKTAAQLIDWPEYTIKDRKNIVFRTPSLAIESTKYDYDDVCSMWDSVGYLH